MHINLTPNQIECFWRRVDKTGDCHIWTGPTENKGGYGLFRWWQDGRAVGTSAHRIAWVLANGQVPERMDVCHDCPNGDNRLCVNVDHLWLGTRSQNTLDTIAKGRYTLNLPTPKLGESHPNSKLTEQDVRQIRDRYASGNVSQQSLADEFGVTQVNISSIILRKSWGHIV
jgi:hypothetical protein